MSNNDKGWNFADVWELIADVRPNELATIHGTRRSTWAEFDRRADGVAHALLEAGAGQQDKVGQYLYNCPEYLESVFACVKAGLVPVNTNYRYGDEELVYIWDNADAVAVMFHGAFADRIEAIRVRVPGVRLWLWVDDGSGPCPTWAVPYEDAAKRSTERAASPWGRSADDLYMLYTGGTTGMPKGVMWRQDDLYVRFAQSVMHDPEERDMDAVRTRVENAARLVSLPACPLMHGTGAFTSFQTMFMGGAIVTLEGRRFDVEELLSTIEREQVNTVAIVGDAFARPMLAALDENPGRWDISSLVMMVSSGVMWSEPVKQGLLRHHPGMLLVDAFSSSEALGMGQSISSAGAAKTAKFMLGEHARVFTDDGREVVPGSGDMGRVAVRGRCPVGYYKDPEKSGRTFPVIDGERYSVPGDYATVEVDGTLRLLGRGSVCINTGGEKVYPEEVEEALKEHDAVRDAVVVGVPDERFGEVIVAWVEPAVDGETDIDEAAVIAHVKSRLAGYKAPRRVLTTETIGRSPAGKVDYSRLKREAVQRIGT